MIKECKRVLYLLERNGQMSPEELIRKSDGILNRVNLIPCLTALRKKQAIIKIKGNKYAITDHGFLLNINSNPHKDLMDDAKLELIKFCVFVAILTVLTVLLVKFS